MHVIYEKDGYRIIFDHDNCELEIQHNGKLVVGGSAKIPGVLDAVEEMELMKDLGIHAADIDGWLEAYARWRQMKSNEGYIPETGQLILPHLCDKGKYDKLIVTPKGDNVSIQLQAFKEEDEVDIIHVTISKSNLKKITAFFC